MRVIIACGALALAACRGNSQTSLPEQVGGAFESCKPGELRFLATKHNVQLAFAPCSNPSIAAFSWSPTGFHLYFQLLLSSYVMDADNRARPIMTLPLPQPLGPGAWLSPQQLAVPIIPAEDGGPARLALYDLGVGVRGASTPSGRAAGLTMFDLGALRDPADLQRGTTASTVLLTGRDGEHADRVVWELDTATGVLLPAFGARLGAVDTFSFAAGQGLALVGRGGRVELVDTTTGGVTAAWDDALRGSLHPDGRWVVLESLGAPTALYDQRTWDERPAAPAGSVPAWAPREGRPPTLSVVDREDNSRWRLTALQGERFQWYEAASNWGSFFLWGFEGKQLQRNVALADFSDRLRAIAERRITQGIEPYAPSPP